MTPGNKSSYTAGQKWQAQPINAVNKSAGGGRQRYGAARMALILFGMIALLAGCDTYYRRSASVDPTFPPAPANPINAPGTDAQGINQRQ